MNSIFSILPLARYTMPMPSPVAITGLVVVRYTCPLPPVAKTVIPRQDFDNAVLPQIECIHAKTFYLGRALCHQISGVMLGEYIHHKTMLDDLDIFLRIHGAE